ncbi:MAG: hypothetical protein ACTSPY_05690 [Candidatus Helarchaeota archaeon]
MKKYKCIIIFIIIWILILPIFINNYHFSIINKRSNAILIFKKVLIHTDPTGDEEDPNIGGSVDHDAIDIVNIYENNNMSVINVTFVSTPASMGAANDRYQYFCLIDSNHDNSTAEFEILYFEIIGMGANSTIKRISDGYYWNGTNWTNSYYSDSSFAYISGNSVIFNFSSCSDCVIDNFYHIKSEYAQFVIAIYVPRAGDWARGNQANNPIFFAGQSSGADLDGPTINEITLKPAALNTNENITIQLNITDISGVDKVIIYIQTLDETTIDQFELFDDGNHNDGGLNDNIFANQWNVSNTQNGTYIIDIFTNDTLGNSRTKNNIRDFIINEIKNVSTFNGLYYSWTGSIGGLGWQGNESYSFMNNNRFNVAHTDNSIFGGTGSFEINNVTRLRLNSDINNYPELTYSFFIINNNLKINDSVPITLLISKNTLDFNVSDIVAFEYNGIVYKCWKLENGSGGVAYYDFKSGIIISGNFTDTLTCTVNLDGTNATLTLGPNFPIIEPENKTYYYTHVPIICENQSMIDKMWYRNRTSGGPWSNNYSLSYNSSTDKWENISILQWQNGYHEIEVFANDTDGVTFSKIRGFSIDDRGPEIYIQFPKSETYLKNITQIIVTNNTLVDSIWYRSSTDQIVWTENFTLEWDPIKKYFKNDTLLISNIGYNYLQVFANETTSNETAIRNITFNIYDYPVNITWYNIYNDSKPSIGVNSNNITYIVWATQINNLNSSIYLLTIENDSYSNPIRLNNPNTYGISPVIKIDNNDVVHVAWIERESLIPLYYVAKYTNNSGGIFNNPVKIPILDAKDSIINLDFVVDNNNITHFTYTACEYGLTIVKDIGIYYVNYSNGIFSSVINISEVKSTSLDIQINIFERSVIDIDSFNVAHIVYSYNTSSISRYGIYYTNSSDLSNIRTIFNFNESINPGISISNQDIIHIAWEYRINILTSNPLNTVSILYTNSTTGFSIWDNISSYKADYRYSNTLKMDSDTINGWDIVFISYYFNNSNNPEIALIHNCFWNFHNTTFIENISNSLMCDYSPNIVVDANRGVVFVVWENLESSASYRESEIYLNKYNYFKDTIPPTAQQDPATNFTIAQTGNTVWVNGTASDPLPTYGLNKIIISGSTTLNNVSDWSLNVGNLSNWAFQNVSSITIGTYNINISVIDNSGNIYVLECKISVGGVPIIVNIENPLNQSYSTHYIPIIVSNSSKADSAWYRINNGTGWSNNRSLIWSSSISRWTNQSILNWPNGKYQLQVFMNDSINRIFYSIKTFTIDDVNPFINISEPYPQGNFTTGSVIQIIGFGNGTISRISSIYINSTNFNLTQDPSGEYWGVFTFENITSLSSGHYTINITINDTTGLSTSIIWKFVVDNTNPIIILTHSINNNSVYTGNLISIEGSVNGTFTNITSFTFNNSKFNLDINPTGNLTAPFKLTNNTNIKGQISIKIIVTDEVGLNSSLNIHFYVDNNNPEGNITYPTLNAVQTGINIFIEGFANGTFSNIKNITINSTAFDLIISPINQIFGNFRFTNNTPIASGNKSFEINITDNANFSILLTIKFIVDNILPSINVNSPVNDSILTGSLVNITGYSNGTFSHIINIQINDSRFTLSPIINPINKSEGIFSIINSSNIQGFISIEITIEDEAHLTQTIISRFYIDNLNPSGSIINLGYNRAIRGNLIELIGLANGTGSQISNLTINGSFSLYSSPISNLSGIFIFKNTSHLIDGHYIVNITIIDSVNRTISILFQFFIDNTPPPAPTMFNITIYGNSINLTWTSINDLTNITYMIYRNGVNIVNITDSLGLLYYFDLNLLTGVYNYSIRVIDDAGNVGQILSKVGIIPSQGGTFSPWIWIVVIIIGIAIVSTILIIRNQKKEKKSTPSDKEDKKHEIKSKRIDEVPAPLPLDIVFEEIRKDLTKTKSDKKEFKWYCQKCGKTFRSYIDKKFNCPICNEFLVKYEDRDSTKETIQLEVEKTDSEDFTGDDRWATSRKIIYHYLCPECGKKYRHDKKGIFPCPNCGSSLLLIEEKRNR